MNDEIERNLRDALSDYAAAVPVRERPSVAAADGASGRLVAAKPHGAGQRWVLWAAPAAAAIGVAAVAVAIVMTTSHQPSSPAARLPAGAGLATTTPPPPSASTPSGPSAIQSGPASTAVIGVAYPYDLYTHCGVDEITFGGLRLKADVPLSDGHGNAPNGWSNPVQHGTLTMDSPTAAIFRDDVGHRLRFHVVSAATVKLCD